MKQNSSNLKAIQQHSNSIKQDSSAGPNTVALTPPDYGIDSVDNQVIQTMPAPENNTGLPDQLKAGIESLSGYSLDDVRVHYNSSKPAQLQALAYTQGAEIQVAPGQERHLPHEAWHVVQQRQGRVGPTFQLNNGLSVNNDQILENEADAMGTKALQHKKPTLQMKTTEPTSQKMTTKAWPQHHSNLKAKDNRSIVKRRAIQLKNDNNKGKSHGLSAAGKNEKAWLEKLLENPRFDPLMVFRPGGKSLIGGEKGKDNRLKEKSARIDRQGEGNVQFQVGKEFYACAVFEKSDKADDI